MAFLFAAACVCSKPKNVGNMQKFMLKTALVAVALAASTSASALTIDFTGFSAQANKVTETYANGGVSVTATAGTDAKDDINPRLKEATSPGATSTDPGFYRGLGVTTANNADGSISANEWVQFTIPAGYVVTSVSLTQQGTGSAAFDLLVDSTTVGGGIVSLLNNAGNDGRTPFAPTKMEGSAFIVSSDALNSGGVWVNSLELQLATMPLPAGVLLLGGALAAGGVAARRKAQKA